MKKGNGRADHLRPVPPAAVTDMAASAVLRAVLCSGLLAVCTGHGIFDGAYSSYDVSWPGEAFSQGGTSPATVAEVQHQVGTGSRSDCIQPDGVGL